LDLSYSGIAGSSARPSIGSPEGDPNVTSGCNVLAKVDLPDLVVRAVHATKEG